MTLLRRTSTVALLAALSLTPVAARAADARPGAAIVTTPNIRIFNFGRIEPNYYRGAQPEGHDYADLAALGVKTLINLTSHDAEPNERAMADQAGMKYFQIPMTTHEAPSAAQLAEFLKLVNDPDNQPVYVHCVEGRHRTGVMTAAHRMTDDGWTAAEAFREMKQFNFGASVLHSEFKSFVYRYHPDVVRTAAAPPIATVTPVATAASNTNP